jgi:PKD repeat protein
VKFTVDGTKILANPSDAFAISLKTTIQSDWYDYGYGYGYDEPSGHDVFFGYGYGYGPVGYSDITFLYDINYTTHRTGTFYADLTVNCSTYTYISTASSTFLVTSTSGGGSGGGTSSSNSIPIAKPGGPYTGYVNTTIIFNGTQSYDPDGEILSYQWDLGDETIKNGSHITHLYPSEGNYTIILTVTDDKGSSSSNTTSARITSINSTHQMPIVKPMIPTEGITQSMLSFSIGGTYDPDGTIVNYSWDFGDGTTSQLMNTTHMYTTEGSYTVTFTVEDNDGLTNATSVTIRIFQPIPTDIEQGFLIDVDGDGLFDTFYNESTQKGYALYKMDDGTYLIDTNEDGIWDYIYHALSGEITPYGTEEQVSSVPWILIMIVSAIFTVIMVFIILFKKGILYFEKDDGPKEK